MKMTSAQNERLVDAIRYARNLSAEKAAGLTPATMRRLARVRRPSAVVEALDDALGELADPCAALWSARHADRLRQASARCRNRFAWPRTRQTAS